MNLFLAARLPEQTIQQILEQTNSLRKDYADFNWVPPENLHITLYYIGEVADDKVHHVVEYVDKTIFDVEETMVYGQGADLFIHKQIVLYLHFQKNHVIEDLHKRFKNLFEDNSKKAYKPHITIARYKVPSKQQYFHLKKKLERMDVELDFPVKEIHLLQSISRSTNPLYNLVKTFPLQEKE